MARATEETTSESKRPVKREPPRKFEAPDSDLTSFGVMTQQEDFIDGFVESAKVRDLLDTFGLADRSEVVFPFQHVKRLHGEIWRMRIEPAVDRMVDGKHLHSHHWVFSRDFPERVAGAQ